LKVDFACESLYFLKLCLGHDKFVSHTDGPRQFVEQHGRAPTGAAGRRCHGGAVHDLTSASSPALPPNPPTSVAVTVAPPTSISTPTGARLVFLFFRYLHRFYAFEFTEYF
jgi:hypothetical protein